MVKTSLCEINFNYLSVIRSEYREILDILFLKMIEKRFLLCKTRSSFWYSVFTSQPIIHYTCTVCRYEYKGIGEKNGIFIRCIQSTTTKEPGKRIRSLRRRRHHHRRRRRRRSSRTHNTMYEK